MAAAMQNRGQVFAHDSDRNRLAPIYDRLKRAGVRNVQVRPPAEGALDDLVGKLDRVVIDAPCTGSGTWRRRPDAKWKLTPEQVAARASEQKAILEAGARYVKPGGTLVYITCSILPTENGGAGGGLPRRAPRICRRAGRDCGTTTSPARRARNFCPRAGCNCRRGPPGRTASISQHCGGPDATFQPYRPLLTA